MTGPEGHGSGKGEEDRAEGGPLQDKAPCRTRPPCRTGSPCRMRLWPLQQKEESVELVPAATGNQRGPKAGACSH